MKKGWILLLAALGAACTPPAGHGGDSLQLRIFPPEGALTRSAPADETRLSDCQILIFNDSGVLEEDRYIPWREMSGSGPLTWETTLLHGAPYTILAVANLGYRLQAASLEEALALRYWLSYPDEWSQGLPMAARLDHVTPGRDGPVDLRLERLLARVDLRMDRRSLQADAQLRIRSVTVGASPRNVQLFSPGKARTREDLFQPGYGKDGAAADSLNRDESLGLSFPVSLYLLENCQGDLPEGDFHGAVCSYIEIQADYHSDSWDSRPGQPLIYRFYLGEGPGNYDVRRNSCYRISVRPEGNGLGEDSWRVDHSGLEPRTRFTLHPAAYNECRAGEDFHLWCELTPAGTPLEIEALAWDEDEDVAGIYDYSLDPDGNGLTLHTKKGGTAVIYFNAGPPVSRDTLAMVVIAP